MLEYTEYIKIFIALLSVVDPLGTVPIFLALTANSKKSDLHVIARTVVLAVTTILLAALFWGQDILVFFGISIHSFRVSGGILLMIMAVSMLQAKVSAIVQTQEEAREGESKESIAIVPLAMPLLAGPGAISTVVLYAPSGYGINHYLLMSLDIVVVALILWIILRCTHWLNRHLSKTAINIFTRLMGLLLSALAVEFMATGLKGLFPVLAG